MNTLYKKNNGVRFSILFSVFVFLSLLAKCLYFQYATKINVRPLNSMVNNYMLLATAGMLFIISAVIFLVPARQRLWVLFLVNSFISVFLAADTLYYRYYNAVITVPVLFQVKLIGAVGGSITSLAVLRDAIFIADLPFLLAAVIFMWYLEHKSIIAYRQSIKKRLLISAAIIAVGVVMQITPILKLNAFTVDNSYIIRKWGVLYFHFDDTKKFIIDNVTKGILTKAQKDEVASFFDGKSASLAGQTNRLQGIAKGKNLIMVQVEALQQFAVGRMVNGKEITPNLNKLANEWIYFDNIYHQVAGGNTSDAEFLANVSMYPAKEGSVYFRYPSNMYYSLAKELKKINYNTYVSHAYIPSYWNRSTAYNFLGYDKYFNINDYKIDEYAGWAGFALSDRSFFRQTLDKIDTSSPFYSFMITLSGHHPFTYFNDKKNFDVGEYEGTIFGSYLKSLNYSDKCLGELIDELKKRGLYDNTLIVIYGDHSGLPENQAQDLKKYLSIGDNKAEWMSYQKVPLFMHYPGMEKGERISVTGGQVDIYPTVSNLMGLTPKYTMGKDLLNTKTGFALLRGSNIATDSYIYISSEDKCYSLEDFKQVTPADFAQVHERAITEERINGILLAKDAFNKLKTKSK